MTIAQLAQLIEEQGAEAGPWFALKLRQLAPENLGLADKMANLDRQYGWQCESLFQIGDFNCSLFMVPKGHILPIHDHPQMHVWFRVVWGELKLHSYDWFDPWPMSGWAIDRGAQVLDGASPTQLIQPKSFNLHSIEALTDAAFIDLFYPGYCDEERPCHYFRATEQHPDHPQLRRLEAADNLG